MACVFCERIAAGETVVESELSAAFRDAYPVSNGHTLVVPKRHVEGAFSLSEEEQHDLLALIRQVKTQLDSRLRPAGYNVGVNAGTAAGQTVAHVHVHVIPRYDGDVPDPRGGVRWVIPKRAAYWDEDA